MNIVKFFHKVLIWVISNKGFSAVESKIGINQVKEKTLAYGKSVEAISKERSEQSKELHDLLIAPIEPLLSTTRACTCSSWGSKIGVD